MSSIIHIILELYIVVLIARILLSYFPISSGSPLVPVVSFVRALTEPVLGPVRRALPPMRVGGMGLDLSPTIVVFVLYALLRIFP
jgi:YggT family protein